MRKILLLLFLFAISFTLVSAIQPQQAYNKIYLNPFYRASMSINTNYTYTLNINPPDGISSILSAIISADIYQTPTVTYFLLVNNQPCSTNNYTVSTTYSGAGQGRITFDCSNIITKAGNYIITLRPTQANTGASTIWLDLTYMNNPEGKIEVKGTEYYTGDDGTLFLKLQDSQGNLVHNATCDVSIYYPNLAYQIHPPFIQQAQMSELNRTGLYYYDFVIPSVAGLYMADAQCSYYADHKKYYEEASVLRPNRTTLLGTYTGDSIVLNSISDWLYTQCDSVTSGGNKACDSYYDWSVDNSSTISNMYVNYLGESSSAPTLTFYYWNWTTGNWIGLPNTLLFHATAGSGVPSGVDEYQSNPISDIKGAINSSTKVVRIRTATLGGSTFKLFSNYLSIDASHLQSFTQNLKGSGEIHVSSFTPDSLTGRFFIITTCSAFNDGRCGEFEPDTYYNLAEGTIHDFMNITAISTRVNADINYQTGFSVDCTSLYYLNAYNGTDWISLEQGTDYDLYSKPVDENCLITIHQPILSGQQYQYEFIFDNYMKWEVDYSKQIAESIMPQIDKYCQGRYNYSVPIDTGTILPTDNITDFCYRAYDDFYYINSFYDDSLSVNLVGEYASYQQEMRFYRKELYNRFLFLALNSNTTLLPSETWTYPTRNLTFYPSVNTTEILNNVWNATNRTLTYYPDQTNYTKIATDVWTNNSTIISDNILLQIATKIWNFAYRYTHGEIV